MRLIDADALKAKAFGKRGGLIHTADIDAMPTIEPERKKGRWVNNDYGMPVCNQCGYWTPFDHAADDYEYGNFCPSCGADMREQE